MTREISRGSPQKRLHFGGRFYRIQKVRERQNTTLSTLNTCIVYTDIIIVYTDIIIVYTDH